MNKRDFLITGTAALAVAQAAAATGSASTEALPVAHRPHQRPDLLSAGLAGSWEPYVGDHFEFEGQPMVLERVETLDSPAGQVQFDLVFRASPQAGAAAPAGLGTLKHGSTGQQLMLHLQDSQGARSVAHFNLIETGRA